MRPTSGPGLSKRSRNNTNNGVHERHKSKLPRGMYINHDDIVKLAKQDADGTGDNLLTNMDREISTLLTQVRFISYLFHLETFTEMENTKTKKKKKHSTKKNETV